MKLTAREIVKGWAASGTNLSGIERSLELPFGSLMLLVKQEGPASPELEALLNMVYNFPSLIDVADTKFTEKYLYDKSVYESAIKQLTNTLDDFIGQCLADDGEPWEMRSDDDNTKINLYETIVVCDGCDASEAYPLGDMVDE